MLTYLLVKGLGSAHYPVFGGSNPPVSIGEHGISRLGAVEACCAHNAKVPGSKPGVANGSTVKAYLAQSVERKTFNLVVVGSTPTVGNYFFLLYKICITKKRTR